MLLIECSVNWVNQHFLNNIIYELIEDVDGHSAEKTGRDAESMRGSS